MTSTNDVPMDRNTLFHRLWTKAVGTKTYDKQEWLTLDRMLHGSGPATPQNPPHAAGDRVLVTMDYAGKALLHGTVIRCKWESNGSDRSWWTTAQLDSDYDDMSSAPSYGIRQYSQRHVIVMSGSAKKIPLLDDLAAI